MSKRWREEVNEKNLLGTCKKAKQEQKLTPQRTMCHQPLEVTPGRSSSWKGSGEVESARMICFRINLKNKGWKRTTWLWNWNFTKLQIKQILQLGFYKHQNLLKYGGEEHTILFCDTPSDRLWFAKCKYVPPIWQNICHKCKESTPTLWPHRPTPQEGRDQSKVQSAAKKHKNHFRISYIY